MLTTVDSKFSHVKSGQTEFKTGGLRDFFLYRDLGIAEAKSVWKAFVHER